MRARQASLVATLLASLLAAVCLSPAVAGTRAVVARPATPVQETAELTSSLADDGTFVGSDGVSGTIDASAWNLVSDLAAGEPPRFEPAGESTNDVVSPDGVEWQALGGSGNGPLSANVRTMVISGGNLFVGGHFTNAAGIPEADYIARWDGSAWSALGGAGNGVLNSGVSSLALSGVNLYVGGYFTDAAGIAQGDYVAVWNGASWSALGGAANGALGNTVYALAVSGDSVYVGGAFLNAAGIAEADNVARWNGAAWSALGGSGNGAVSSHVFALAVSGSVVYVGGSFQNTAGIAQADYIAAWNGASWSALGGGTNGALGNVVYALGLSGSTLFAGGFFVNAAGIAQADYVARWSGTAWSALGGGTNGALSGGVQALAIAGSNVYVGGVFTDAAGIAQADHVARWNGSAWSALGGAGNGAIGDEVQALAAAGSAIYVGGFFTNSAGIAEGDYLALAIVPGPWAAVGGTGNGALNGSAYALAIIGSDLYVGGGFTNAAGIATADYVARWNGSSWSALGSNVAGTDGALSLDVYALAVSGTQLYVGGEFLNAAGIATADYVARWNGSAWSGLGSNVAGTNGALSGLVSGLAISGSDLYVVGFFVDAAGIAAGDYVARWSGTAWSALGSNGAGNGPLNQSVHAVAVAGNDLYVGGAFLDAANIAAADKIARWNGNAWSALGTNAAGTDGALTSGVIAIAVSGGHVYAAGSFTNAAGIPTADFVARWSGTSWSALGSNVGGTNGALNSSVGALAVVGTDVYAGGHATNVAGIDPADRLARWNGSSWSAIGSNGAGDGALVSPVRVIKATPTQ